MTSENIIQGNTIKPTLKSLNKRCPALSAHAQDGVSCQMPTLTYVSVGGNSEPTQILPYLKLTSLWTPSVSFWVFTHGLISLNF